MTGAEARSLPEVECPNGGASECCTFLSFGRRVCSYPVEAHMTIILSVFRSLKRERQISDQDRSMQELFNETRTRLGL